MELTAAGRRLRAALAAVTVQGAAPELQMVHRWLNNWRGAGQIAEGMHRAGWDLQLTEYGDELAGDVRRDRRNPARVFNPRSAEVLARAHRRFDA